VNHGLVDEEKGAKKVQNGMGDLCDTDEQTESNETDRKEEE